MVFSSWYYASLLGLVHFFGYGDDVGARSWISHFGFGSIQPSEVAKLVIIIYFSSVFAKKYEAGTIDNLNQSIGPPIIILSDCCWFSYDGNRYWYVVYYYYGCTFRNGCKWH